MERKNNITELVFILDRSGSMSGLEADTIGGFNAMIEKQRKEDGECYVSTVLFDNYTEVLHDRVKLSEIKPMTNKEYTVRGCTALIDALGGAIHHIGNVHKYARPEDVPAHTMFIITTDGMENASRKYTSERVKQMIERQKERYGWEFLFIPELRLAIEAEATTITEQRSQMVKEHICECNGIRYVKLKHSNDLIKTAQSIKEVFRKCHTFFQTNDEEDIEILRTRFQNWRKQK